MVLCCFLRHCHHCRRHQRRAKGAKRSTRIGRGEMTMTYTGTRRSRQRMMTEGGAETIMRPPICCKQQKLWNFGRGTGEGKGENEDNALMRRRKGRKNGNNGTKQYGRSSALYSGSNTSTAESKKSTTTSKNFSGSMSPPWINMPLR